MDSILRGAFTDLFTTPDLPPVPSLPLRFVAPYIRERRRITPVSVPIKGSPRACDRAYRRFNARGVHLHPAKVILVSVFKALVRQESGLPCLTSR